LRLDAMYAPALIGLGRIYLVRREWAPALQVLEQARQLDPKNDDVWFSMGVASYGLRKLPEAAAAYQQSLALNDKRAAAYYQLARTLYDQDSSAAPTRLREAITRDGAATWVPEAWRLLGYFHYKRGAHAEMCASFTRYLEVAPPSD